MTRKVIIVDDDVDFLSWLRFGLMQKGQFQVLTAETVTEGMYLICHEKPDLAIVDLKLPDGDGYELCRRIREQRPIPVLLITGVFREIEAWRKGREVGANDLLIKPFSYEQMLECIDKHLPDGRRPEKQHA